MKNVDDLVYCLVCLIKLTDKLPLDSSKYMNKI